MFIQHKFKYHNLQERIINNWLRIILRSKDPSGSGPPNNISKRTYQKPNTESQVGSLNDFLITKPKIELKRRLRFGSILGFINHAKPLLLILATKFRLISVLSSPRKRNNSRMQFISVLDYMIIKSTHERKKGLWSFEIEKCAHDLLWRRMNLNQHRTWWRSKRENLSLTFASES